MSATRLLFSSLLVAAPALVACVAPSGAPERESTARSSAPIINGEKSTEEEDSAVAVANFPEGGGLRGACSGVLISPTIVLTARHCVSRTDEGALCSKDGKPISGGKVYEDHPAKDLGILVGPTLKFMVDARGKKVMTTGVNHMCDNDIAIVILDKAIPNAKVAQIRLDAPPVKDDKVLAVGWGQSNNSTGYMRRRRADIPIIGVGPASGSAIGGVVGAKEFAIGEGICSGDSGGPAYDMKTKAVLGVVSRGTNGAPYDPDKDPPYTRCLDSAEYKTHNLYTRVDTFKDFIMSAFAETGEEPWLEGQPDPRKKKFGEDCLGPDSCRSGLCIEAGGKRFCSEICTDKACPEGYSCQAAGDTKVCAPGNPTTSQPLTDPGTSSSKGCEIAKPRASDDALASAWVAALVAAGIVVVRRRRMH